MSNDVVCGGLFSNRHQWKRLDRPEDHKLLFKICQKCGRCEKAIWSVRGKYHWEQTSFSSLKTEYEQMLAEHMIHQAAYEAEAPAAIAFIKTEGKVRKKEKRGDA